MFGFSLAQLDATLDHYLMILFRVAAMFVSMPVFSGHYIAVHVRVLFSIVVTGIIGTALPLHGGLELFSLSGLLMTAEQVLLGIMMGFILQLVFGAMVFAGQTMAYSMGLGFASLIDPQTGVQVPAISQFYIILTTLLFLAMDGHLVFIKMMADSFTLVPVDAPFHKAALWLLVSWSSQLLVIGTTLALPVTGLLLLVNMGFGVGTRAAPQLNIFSVGFPVTLTIGLLLMWYGLGDLVVVFSSALRSSYAVVNQLLRVP